MEFAATIFCAYILLVFATIFICWRKIGATTKSDFPGGRLVRHLARLPAPRLLRISTAVSVGAALSMAGVKFVAWLYTGSVSVLSSLVESGVHTLAAVLNFIAIRYALRPPDTNYRFGHGKAEPLAGLLRAVFVGGLALLIIGEAIETITDPAPVTHADRGIGFMLLVIAILFGVVAFQHYVASKTGSTAIGADALQYKADVLINLGVVLSLAISGTAGWAHVDPIIAVMIAIYILAGVWPLSRRAFRQLMDRELSDRDQSLIREIIVSHPAVGRIRDLRTRSTGIGQFVQFRLSSRSPKTLDGAHRTSEQIARRIRRAFPQVEVIITHDGPIGGARKS